MELDVQKVGKTSYRIALGDDEVVVRGDDPDACVARAIELLSDQSGKTIIARDPDAIVIDVPRFESAGKSTAPKASKKG